MTVGRRRAIAAAAHRRIATLQVGMASGIGGRNGIVGRRPSHVRRRVDFSLDDLNLSDWMEVDGVDDFRADFRWERLGRFVPSAVFFEAEKFAQ